MSTRRVARRVRPASWTIPPMVSASTWSCLGDGQDPPAVGHDDVLALPGDVEPSLLERPHGPKVTDPGYLRHALRRDFYFPQILLTGQLFGDFEVFANRVLNVRQSFLFSGALRPAPGEAGTIDAVALVGWHQRNWVLHISHCSMQALEGKVAFSPRVPPMPAKQNPCRRSNARLPMRW
jgi:hypothetical protein